MCHGGNYFIDMVGNKRYFLAVEYLPIAQIRHWAKQPRISKGFLESSYEKDSLVQSIRENGVLEPILVRPIPGGPDEKGRYWEIIAGERRLRAARAAGLENIPAIIKEVSDQEAFKLAVEENAIRNEMNPIEQIATAIRLIMSQQGLEEETARWILRERYRNRRWNPDWPYEKPDSLLNRYGLHGLRGILRTGGGSLGPLLDLPLERLEGLAAADIPEDPKIRQAWAIAASQLDERSWKHIAEARKRVLQEIDSGQGDLGHWKVVANEMIRQRMRMQGVAVPRSSRKTKDWTGRLEAIDRELDWFANVDFPSLEDPEKKRELREALEEARQAVDRLTEVLLSLTST